MSNAITFITANFVARQAGYQISNWGEGVRATHDYFQPIATYAQRLDELLQEVVAMGFSALDLWTDHLHQNWATDEHIAIAKALFQKYHFTLFSLAGGFGATPEEVERTCRLSAALGIPLLAGGTPLLRTDRATLVALLRQYGLKFGFENHPEKTPQEVLALIGEQDEDVIGVALDTGWFGTQAYDAAKALQELAPRLFHVHLKDVLAAGGHETCRYGRGVVPIEACVETLKQIGYQGPIAVEHEPDHFDPTADIVASKEMLVKWLA